MNPEVDGINFLTIRGGSFRPPLGMRLDSLIGVEAALKMGEDVCGRDDNPSSDTYGDAFESRFGIRPEDLPPEL